MEKFSIVPPEQVGEVVQEYINEGYTQVTAVKNEYGLYVVRAL